MDTGIALLLALVAAAVVYGVARWARITVLSSIVLALFFGSIILALLANPQEIYNNRSATSSQVYIFVMALVGIVLVAYLLYKAFTDKDCGKYEGYRIW
jgi:hypothetical protein